MNAPGPERQRRFPLVVAGLAVAGLLLVLAIGYWSLRPKTPAVHPVKPRASAQAEGHERAAIPADIVHFCGNCHATPDPMTFPRQAWEEEVLQGYDFYKVSRRQDLQVPPVREVVAWYRNHAPFELSVAAQPAAEAVPPLRFRQTSVPLKAGQRFSAVAHLRWLPPAEGIPPGGPRAGQLLFCDMNSGDVGRLDVGDDLSVIALGQVANAAHVEPCDLDADGQSDLLVSGLGSLLPGDHDLGCVVWLRGLPEADRWEPHVIAAGLGRVCDARAADFDADGDADIVVAEFGWHQTGRILWLENRSLPAGPPTFEIHVLDQRHGTIHVSPADLNGDGHMDFVALISQEYESVEAFLNQGGGTFRRETIFAAGDPSYGSSGIQLVDLDSDGDLDVLYTNGDTVDSYYLKPWHSIQWLENRGQYPFVPRVLTSMPGVYRAIVTDLDSDQDLDVLACAFIPGPEALGNHPGRPLDTLIWLEQTGDGDFQRHSLSTALGHVSIEAGDFNGDGRTDFITGSYFQSEAAPWMTVWWNTGPTTSPDVR